jgi:hypothetical protein
MRTHVAALMMMTCMFYVVSDDVYMFYVVTCDVFWLILCDTSYPAGDLCRLSSCPQGHAVAVPCAWADLYMKRSEGMV